jgi:hypothetical protein
MYCHNHSVYARRLGALGARIPGMVGNVAFLMKDVVLLAVSFYLLKQDLFRATLSESTLKAAPAAFAAR